MSLIGDLENVISIIENSDMCDEDKVFCTKVLDLAWLTLMGYQYGL